MRRGAGAVLRVPVAPQQRWCSGGFDRALLADYAALAPRLRRFSNQVPEPIDGRKIVHRAESVDGCPSNNPQVHANARWLRREIPRRLARGVVAFWNVPFVFAANPYIYSVYLQCWEWFRAVADIDDDEAPDDFLRRLKTLRNVGILRHLALGIQEVKAHPNADLIDFAALDKFLAFLCTYRAAWRSLVDHHISLAETGASRVFNPECNPLGIAEAAGRDSATLCRSQYGVAPDCVVTEHPTTHPSAARTHFIDDYLRYLLTELTKNAMRATVEHWQEGPGKPPASIPPVRVDVCSGHDVTIKVSDAGGGIKPAWAEKVFRFGWSSVALPLPDAAARITPHQYFLGGTPPPLPPKHHAALAATHLAGYGFGLPLSRCFMRQFGGSIELRNMPGYGLDVTVKLPREPLEQLTAAWQPPL